MKRLIVTLSLILVLFTVSRPVQSKAALDEVSIKDVVPNEYIVRFKDNSSPTELQALINEREIRSQTFGGRLENLREDLTNQLSGKQSPNDAFSAIQSTNDDIGATDFNELSLSYTDQVYVIKTDGTKSLEATLDSYEALGKTIEFIEPNFRYYALTIPNDEFYDEMWALKKIGFEDAWDTTTGSAQVKVAVIDTGVLDHPDLGTNVIDRKITGSQTFVSAHGTHVSGTIGALGNNTTGIPGINWTVGIIGIKADTYDPSTGDSYFGSQGLLNAMDYAVQQGASVINMSLGGSSASQEFQNAINNAYSNGVVVVAAAGNTGDRQVLYPASYNHVISVSSTDPNDNLASYSTYGPSVDIAAPGGDASRDRNGDGRRSSSDCVRSDPVCILSTWSQNSYKDIVGTSMASPHVAGLAALIKAANQNLTASQIETILFQTAVDLGTSGKDEQFGYGRIDAKAAIEMAVSGNIPTAAPSPTGGTQPSPTGQQPTATPATGSPTPTSSAPSPTGSDSSTHPCPDQARQGDYNCDGNKDNSDYTSWESDYKVGASESTLSHFESIRRLIMQTAR